MSGYIATSPIKNIEQHILPSEGKDISNRKSTDTSEKIGKHTIEKPDIAFIERTSRTALIEQNAITPIEAIGNDSEGIPEFDEPTKEGLTDEEKTKIKEETGWSDEIIEYIQNMKQYEILKNAGLKEVEINGRKCLVKENFDPDYVDEDGVSNRDRIKRGLSPLDNDGNKIYLHHLGQKANSPLVELTFAEHRQGGNDTIWHDKNKETEVHGEGNTWNSDRKEYWSEREKQFDGGNS